MLPHSMASSFARPIRILMLQRDEGAVDLARSSFELAGLPTEIEAHETPLEAFVALRGGAWDVVLADLSVEGSEGFFQKLRKSDATRKLPLIALSDAPDDASDYVFARPRDEGEYMGIVAAIKFFWMNEAPSLPPPPPAPEPAPGQPSVRPQRLSNLDLMTLPIEPSEAYLLSILDGELGVDEIGAVIGAPVAETRRMLRRLADLGAVRWSAPHPSLPPPPPPSISSAEHPAVQVSEREPEAPEEEGRFTEARKRQVDDALALLDEADHYELLGVPRDASRQDIRQAYFALAKLFHTDTLFGVELGEYRQKMDRVFTAITEAYDVLGKTKRRREYDEYLGAVQETAALEDAAPPEPEPAPAPPPPKEEPPAKPPSRPRMTRSETMRAVAARRVQDLRAQTRRDAQLPPAAGKPTALSSLSRALTQVSRTSGRLDRADRLIADAREAEAKGNLAGAAEALRIAVAWRPNDDALRADAERLRWEAAQSKAAAFEKRARYAQERLKWDEAARCWAKVADARPNDADAQEAAGLAALRSGEDLQRAAKHARRATELRPEKASGHRLLGQIYAAAQKPESARRSLKRALELDPKDEDARRLLTELG